ncbi:hypothetical protein [Gloeocapsopsis dulcis]|uniref:Uncharacterized protein n=1 Tax=Gloeocapsopsis dulcis AAB1 = 1H9 TaxID=1433147 RepID=A0A6N8FR00_9CHRO|nr:hypothetical protein [Gloeocapsopsis dulcis]MUL35214.1 hypothetical protein [Gloeocapsopsis dulcis AAB1 = 1H9]WNN89099.1 hypothetical protein P0S91_23070 [Gloeocapsopsis dulcis]
MLKYLQNKLGNQRKRKRILYERLTEPLHLNLLSIFVALFGSFEQKIEFDLVIRQQYAFCLLQAAKFAKSMEIQSVTAIEFGVAAGAGLLNICEITKKITQETGVQFQIFGFDSGQGLPPPRDYRDIPETFKKGDYPIVDKEKLLQALPDNAKLIVGDIAETVPEFIKTISQDSPIGFIAVDVDYYWSAKECLKVLLGEAEKYLPITLIHLDDIGIPSSNPWVGELLAVNEFNAENSYRKIHPYTFLRNRRIFKHTRWIDHIFVMHTLDHKRRSIKYEQTKVQVLSNPYL